MDGMIWTFERGDEVLRLETRIDNATGEYLIVSMWAERPPEIERFRDPRQYRRPDPDLGGSAHRESVVPDWQSPHPLRRLARPDDKLKSAAWSALTESTFVRVNSADA